MKPICGSTALSTSSDLQREGRLDDDAPPAPSRRRLWLVFLAGAVVLTLGVVLLIVVLVATLEK